MDEATKKRADIVIDISEYFHLQKKIHEHFGYVEDWKVIPLVDHCNMYWILFEDKNDEGVTYGGEINYHENPFKDGYSEPGDYYNATLYTQRFLPKWIYRTEDYTMVCMDTHCDLNQYIGIFDNNKEQSNVKY